MTGQLTLQIKNCLESVHSANDEVSRWLAGRGGSPEMEYFANLAIEELGTNCIKYGYDDAKEHWIEVNLSVSANDVILTITDDGRPFNPLAAPDSEVTAALEERPIGGLGIHLVRKMADRMEYIREQGRNKLTLYKTFGNTGPMGASMAT